MNYPATIFVLILLLVAIACSPPHYGVLHADQYFDRPALLEPRLKRDSQGRERLIAETLLLEARILQKRGENVPALRKYQRAWRLVDGSTTILKQIVPLALELGRVEEATRYALLLAESDLDDPFLAERLAMLMSDQLEFDRSLQLYQRVLKLRSQDTNARNPIAMQFEMGRLYFLTQKYDQAAQSFRVVLQALDGKSQDPITTAFRQAIGKDPHSVYTLIAEAFLEAGNYDEAETVYRKANEQSPNHQWLTLQLARVDYRAGRYREAQEKLQAYVRQKLRFGGQTPYELLQTMMDKAQEEDISPKGDTTLSPQPAAAGKEGKNAQESVEKDETQNTFVRFRDWLADDPDNFPLLSYVAEMTRRQGVLQDAATLYEKSIARKPTRQSYQKLLRIYQDLGNTDKLLHLLSQILSDSESLDGFRDEVTSITADQELVRNLWQLGRDRLRSKPANARDIARTCGLLALEVKNYAVAEEFFEQLAATGRESELYVTWGLQLLADEDFDRAAQVFQAGLDSTQDANAEAILMYYLSGALQLDGDTEGALKVANEVAEKAKQIPEFTLRPAWILYSAKRTAEAKELYAQWMESHTENYSVPGLRDVVRDARFVLSSIYIDLGEIDEAVEALEKILDEYPNHAGAMNDLGYLLVDNHRSLQRATKMIQFAVSREPDNPMYRDSLGWALVSVAEIR